MQVSHGHSWHSLSPVYTTGDESVWHTPPKFVAASLLAATTPALSLINLGGVDGGRQHVGIAQLLVKPATAA